MNRSEIVYNLVLQSLSLSDNRNFSSLTVYLGLSVIVLVTFFFLILSVAGVGKVKNGYKQQRVKVLAKSKFIFSSRFSFLIWPYKNIDNGFVLIKIF